jgi:hypothetical protein
MRAVRLLEVMTQRRRTRSLAFAAGILLVVGGGCAPATERLAVEPGVTFAAHRVHAGLMIDAMRNGEPALLGPATWLRLPGEATFVLSDGDARGEALWVRGPGAVVVRRTDSADSPIVGTVVPSWDNNAIRIAIDPAGGPAFRTDVFTREDIGGGVSTLTRIAQLAIDLNGTYRAAVRDPGGRQVGWIRVAVGLHQPAPEMYTAVLPPEIDEGLAAASAAALGEEIDWIEDHTYDVYAGTELHPGHQ